MKTLILISLLFLFGIYDCQHDQKKDDINQCLNITSTFYRPTCKHQFTVHVLLFLDRKDDDEADRHLELIKPMLEPCMKLSDENHTSTIIFRSIDDPKTHICATHSFEDMYNETTIPPSPDAKFQYTPVTSFNWGLNDINTLALFSDVIDTELFCNPHSKQTDNQDDTNGPQPIILFVTNLESDVAAVKFQDMDKRFTEALRSNFTQETIIMKIIWTKPGLELTPEVEAFLKALKESTLGFIDYIVDDLSDPKRVADLYGMCAPIPPVPTTPKPKNLIVPVMSGLGGLLLLILLIIIVIGVIFTQTNWLNRPAYAFFRFLEDRLKIKFKFLIRIHQDLADAGFERYVREYTRGQDDWEIDPANLHISTELLGSGASAVVYQGILTGLPPVIKLFPRARLMGIYSSLENPVAIKRPHENSGAEERIEFLQEIRFMKTLNFHPHILTMLGCYFYPFQPLIVTELCELGDLLTLVRELGDSKTRAQCPIEVDLLPVMAWQVCDALSFLSSINIIHRDVAARNVLVTSAKVAKLSDFGLCRRAKDLMYSGKKVGKMPLKWMAPEAIEKAEYSHKSDMWSYGVLLYEVFSFGTVPYPTIGTEAVLDFIKKGNRLEVPHETPSWLDELMQSCWEIHPNDRPNASDLKTFLYSNIENTMTGYGYLQMSEMDEEEILEMLAQEEMENDEQFLRKVENSKFTDSIKL